MRHLIILLLPLLLVCCNTKTIKVPTAEPLLKASDSVEITSGTNEDIYQKTSKVPSDTTSIEYLQYLTNSGQDINYTWHKKLKQIGDFFLPNDSSNKIYINRIWKINDSISAFELSHSTGVSHETHLVTINKNNRKDIIKKLTIESQGDRDLSSHWYSYTNHKFLNNREVELSINEIVGPEDNEKETIMKEIWTIQENGHITKK